MSNDPRVTWGAWLREQLDERGWKQADLVHASNGHLKSDRVSKWVNGKDRPSHRLTIVTANTLGTSREDALRAAGYSAPGDAKHDEVLELARTLIGINSNISSEAQRLSAVLRDVPDSVLLEILETRALQREVDALKVRTLADFRTAEGAANGAVSFEEDELRAAKHGRRKADEEPYAE